MPGSYRTDRIPFRKGWIKRAMFLKIAKTISLLFTGRFDLLTYKIMEKLGRKDAVPPLPLSLMIEPTNCCNLRCPACPTGTGKLNRPKRMMSLEEFKSIIGQVKGYTDEIVLWNYGEPFLNEALLPMIECAVEAGMRVVASTNGHFFTSREFCREVVKSGLHHLIICLDGADQETISRYRVNADFKEILSGFKLISETKQELGSGTPAVDLQFIVMRHNEHQRETMRKLAEALKVDVYCEKTIGIDRNDQDFQTLCEELLPRDLSESRYRKEENGTFVLKGEIRNRCAWVYRKAVINVDGTVVPCCYDLCSTHSMGNVFEVPLKNIWNGKKYREFRERIRCNRLEIPVCTNCSEGRHTISRKASV